MRRRNVAFGRLQLRPECLCARGPVCAAVWLSRGVLRSGHACCTALSRRFVFVARPLCGSLAAFCVRVTPAVCRMSAKQDGLQYVSFLFRRGSGSPVVRSRASIRLFGLAGSLRAWAFSYGDPDEGTESAARRECVFLRKHISFAMFSAGSPLGLRAPNLRQRVFDSLDSLHLGRGAGAFYAGRGTQIQRRLGRVQFMLGQVVWSYKRSYALSHLSQAAQSGSGHCPPRPKPAPKSRIWKPHCGLSGLSSFGPRRGYVLRGEGDSDTTKT